MIAEAVGAAWDWLGRPPLRCAWYTPGFLRAERLGDLATALAYFSYPLLGIWAFRRSPREAAACWRPIALLLAFVAACGSTHLLKFLTGYWPRSTMAAAQAANVVTPIVSWWAFAALFSAARAARRLADGTPPPAPDRAAIPLALAATVLLFFGIWSYRALSDLLATVADQRRVLVEGRAPLRLGGAIRMAESGQRGYLITDDRRYLDAYERALPMIDEERRAVAASGLWDAPEARAFLADVDAKVVEMGGSVRLAGDGKRKEAIAIVVRGEGIRLMERIGAAALAMTNKAEKIVSARERAASAQADRLLVALPVAAAVAPLVVALGLASALGQYRARVAAEVAAGRAKADARRTAEVLDAMSHDVRTPLNAIVQYAEVATTLLDEGFRDCDRFRDAIERIIRSSRSMADMLGGYLEVVRAERDSVKGAAFPLRSLLADVEALVRPGAERKGLALRVDCPPGLVVRSDRGKLKPILMNLATNAIKFTGRGGVTIEASQARRGITLRVRDTGPGIAPELIPQLFEDFVQGSNPERDPRKGFGLGLAIADRLARQIGATIEVESAPGRGTTFTVTVPDLP